MRSSASSAAPRRASASPPRQPDRPSTTPRGTWRTRSCNRSPPSRASRRSDRGNYEAAAHGILARALLRRDGAAARDAAEAAIAEAAARIERTGARTLAPALCEWRAELAAAVGDEALRDELLAEAQRGYESIGAPKQAERIETGMPSTRRTH